STEQVKPPRHSVQPVETSIPAATLKPTSPKSNRSGKRKNRKTCFVCKSVDHLIKDCDYHAKKKAQPITRNYAHRGTFMPPKPNLVFHTVPIAVETDHSTFIVQLSPSKPAQDLSHTNRPSAPIIEDWVSDSDDESETTASQIALSFVLPVCADVPKIMVTRPRHAHSIDTKYKSLIRRHITRNPSPKTSNSPPKVTVVKAPVVSAAQGMKGKWRSIFEERDFYVQAMMDADYELAARLRAEE
nr:hypothetical protein [Tanacetum cinerariifolium]